MSDISEIGYEVIHYGRHNVPWQQERIAFLRYGKRDAPLPNHWRTPRRVGAYALDYLDRVELEARESSEGSGVVVLDESGRPVAVPPATFGIYASPFWFNVLKALRSTFHFGAHRSAKGRRSPVREPHALFAHTTRMGFGVARRLVNGIPEIRMLFAVQGDAPHMAAQDVAALSASFGVAAGQVWICGACGRVFRAAPTHSWVDRCTECRHPRRPRGRPQDPRVPNALRPALKTLRARWDQRVTRGVPRKSGTRGLALAKVDAERVRDGRMTVAAWNAKHLG